MSAYTLQDLGPGIALDVNDAGHVVGWAETGGWYWDGAQRVTIKSRTETGFFFTARTATQISDEGWVLADFMFIPQDLTSLQTFYWQPGVTKVTTLGLGASSPSTRTTNVGLIVGSLFGRAITTETAPGHLVHDLNFAVQAPGWVLTSANAINSKGQIVGGGTLNGAQHAYLLTPVANRVSRIESYAGFYIEGMKGKLARILASDTEWGGTWRELETVAVTSEKQLWIDRSTPRRRSRDYRIESV